MDTVDKTTRSRIMSRVGQKDTGPEMKLRRSLHKIGLRYRLHDKRLPGSPDVVFPRFKAALFVHGCFWHRHPGCHLTTTPATRPEFWNQKFEKNVARDHKVQTLLEEAGWRVLTIWECETKSEKILHDLLFRIRNC